MILSKDAIQKSAADVTREHAPSRLNARRIERTNARGEENERGRTSSFFVIRARDVHENRRRSDAGASFIHSEIRRRILFERTPSERASERRPVD